MPDSKARSQRARPGSADERFVRPIAPPAVAPARPLDWRRRMSDSIAYALLVYTGLQIFMTVGALRDGTASLLPYFALVLLIAAIVPACRRFERRWNRLSDEAAADPALAPAFRRDNAALWLLAIGLPLGLAGLFRLLAALVRA